VRGTSQRSDRPLWVGFLTEQRFVRQLWRSNALLFMNASTGGVTHRGRPSRPLTRADILSSSDVAELSGFPKSTIEDWARRGVVPSRKRGKRRLFLRWEIEAWLVADDPSGNLAA